MGHGHGDSGCGNDGGYMAITMTATGGDRNKMRKCSKPRAAASDLVFVVCLVGLMGMLGPLGLKA